ncbi:unnamed protein product [Sympodiomycopsis kandeliae]
MAMWRRLDYNFFQDTDDLYFSSCFSGTHFLSMRASLIALSAQLPSTGASGSALLQRTAATLLPPIPLYRRLLRVHRNVLSYEMRSLGDNYLKDEFKRHKKIDNPLQIVGFLGQWKVYLDQLEEAALSNAGKSEGEKKRFFEGRKLEMEQFEKLSEEQMYQLHEFMTATKELYNPTAPGPPDAPQSAADATQDNSIAESEGDRVLKDILDTSSSAHDDSRQS